MAKKRALIYVRQSQLREESISLELQETACRQYAKANNYGVVEVVSDPGVSGLQFKKRPGILRTIQRVEAGDADVILVWKWSRLSRQRTHQAVILDMVEKAGGRVECATEPVDTTTAGGRFSRELLLAAAAFESDTKSEQWKEAQARRLRNGLPTGGGARLGYRLEPRQQGKFIVYDIVVHEDFGQHVKEAYVDYIKGDGFQRIAQRLNDHGVVTGRAGGKPIGVHTLIRAMDSGFAAGLLIVNKGSEFLPGTHDPLIDEETWETYKRERKKRATLPPKARVPKWWLAGLVRCGQCGGVMAVNSHNAAKSQVVCLTYKSTRTCAGTWINRATVERKVALWLGGRVEELTRHGWSDDERSGKRMRLEARLSARTAKRVDAEKAIAKLASGWAQGFIDDEAFRGGRQDLEAQRDALDRELSDIHAALDQLLPEDADVYEKLIDLGEGMSSAQYNTLLRRVIDSVVIGPKKMTIKPVIGRQTSVSRT